MTYEELKEVKEICSNNACAKCPLRYETKNCLMLLQEETNKLLDEYHKENEELKKIIKGQKQLINSLNKYCAKAKKDAYEECANIINKTLQILKEQTNNER